MHQSNFSTYPHQYVPPPPTYQASVNGVHPSASVPPPPQVVHIQGTNQHNPLPPTPSVAPVPPPPPPYSDNVSQISQSSSIMGGRNDQANCSGRHFQGRNTSIGALKSSRRIIKSMTATDYDKFKAAKPSTSA